MHCFLIMPDIADNKITHLIKHNRPLLITDSLSRAVSTMRANGAGAVLVVNGLQVAGIVRESDILTRITSSANGNGINAESFPLLASLVIPSQGFVPFGATIREAMDIFTATGAEVLPVVSSGGLYQGYLQRTDITATVTNAVRPATIGGLATPIGVHLTCGSQRGGVSDWGLFLSGLLLGGLGVLGTVLYSVLALLIQSTLHQPVYSSLLSPSIGIPNWYDAIRSAAAFAPALATLLGFRLLSISGYHAAEHQTVNAVEQGEPLDVEHVRQMPRVHPRCGTNIVVAASIFAGILGLFPTPIIIFPAVFIVLLAWRSIGSWMQNFVTTKKASDKQLESGIRAAEELLLRYRQEVLGAREPGRRLWNIGFPQMIAGLACSFYAGLLIMRIIERVFHTTLPFI